MDFSCISLRFSMSKKKLFFVALSMNEEHDKGVCRYVYVCYAHLRNVPSQPSRAERHRNQRTSITNSVILGNVFIVHSI